MFCASTPRWRSRRRSTVCCVTCGFGTEGESGGRQRQLAGGKTQAQTYSWGLLIANGARGNGGAQLLGLLCEHRLELQDAPCPSYSACTYAKRSRAGHCVRGETRTPQRRSLLFSARHRDSKQRKRNKSLPGHQASLERQRGPPVAPPATLTCGRET